jgi:hypothetical protein
MIAALALAMLAQSGDPNDQDGIVFDCASGADRFWVSVPVNRVRGRYAATAGGNLVSGAAPRPQGEPTSFEQVQDALPDRLLLNWRTWSGGPAALELTDYDAGAGTARYRYQGRRRGAARHSAAVETRGACTARTTTASRPERFEGIARRLDCHVSFFTEEGGRRSAPDGTGDYVFLFLHREPGETGAGRLLYIVSLGDGRSWMERADVQAQTGDRWPDFSATVTFRRSWARFTSDPDHDGRVLYRSDEPHDHSMAYSVAEGPCTLVPQAGSWRS